MEKTIVFNYPPKQVRNYVENWKSAADKDEQYSPEQRAMLEDILQLIDVAIDTLQPTPIIKNQNDSVKQ